VNTNPEDTMGDKLSDAIKGFEKEAEEAAKAHHKAVKALAEGKGTADRVAVAHRRLARITGEAKDAVDRWAMEILANFPEQIPEDTDK